MWFPFLSLYRIFIFCARLIKICLSLKCGTCNKCFENEIITWFDMRSSQTERAICMALGLWVTEIAFILNFSLPKILFAWATASLNTCSNLFWLRTAPILTIFGSQPPRAQEQEMKKAKRKRRIFMVYKKTNRVCWMCRDVRRTDSQVNWSLLTKFPQHQVENNTTEL